MVEVEPGPGDGAFPWRKRNKRPTAPRRSASARVSDGGEHDPQEPALWLQPLQWMEGVVDSVQGKIHCPG